MSRLPRGAAFVLTAERCRQIALCRPLIVAMYQRNGGGLPPGLLADLDAMAAVAREVDQIQIRRDRLRGSGDGSDSGSDPVRIFASGGENGEPAYVGMSEAVDLLKISDTAVRKALAEGRLIGRQRGGPGSSWLIDLGSLERLAEERTSRSNVSTPPPQAG